MVEEILGHRGMNRCRARLGSPVDIEHRRKGFVFGDDCLHAILSLIARSGDDRGDRLADEAHLVPPENRVVAALVAGHRDLDRNGPDKARDVLGGEDAHDTGNAAGGFDSNVYDVGVRNVAAEKGDMQHPGRLRVARVPAPAAQELRVLAAAHAGADQLVGTQAHRQTAIPRDHVMGSI